jgi:hypothetical protein
MNLSLAQNYDFIPKWNDNQKDGKPIKFKLKYLSASEKDECIEMDYVIMNGESKPRVKTNKDKYLIYSLVGIENLNINGREVKTAKDFLECPKLHKLYQEVVNDIIDRNTDLSDDDKKK